MSNQIKFIEIEDRKFSIKKFDAKTSLKISKLIIAKILPVFEGVLPSLNSTDANNLRTEIADNTEEFISLEGISKALELITDEDLDKIIDASLMSCYELLPAGQVQVLNKNGTYGVATVENDPLLVMRLTAEAVIWSIGGFFDADRLTSLLKPMAVLFKPDAVM